MVREIKVSSDWFGCHLVISLYIDKVFLEINFKKVLVVLLTIGPLETLRVLQFRLEVPYIAGLQKLMWKACLPGSERILTKVLDMKLKE